MPNLFSTKFVTLLKTFDREELKSFESWLQSPWCNTNKNLPRLLQQLKKYYPDFDQPQLTKEQIFYKMLPKGKFSPRRMNNLLSEAYQAAEKFLIFQQVNQDHRLQKALLTKAWQRRHLDDWFFKTAHQEIDRLEQKVVKSWQDHLALFNLQRRVYHHPNQANRMQPGYTPIVKMGAELDLLYLLEKAAIINEKITRTRVIQRENHTVQHELKNWEAAVQEIHHPAIELYQLRFGYPEHHRLAWYWQLREHLLTVWDQLNLREQKIQLLSLLNDTMGFIKSGQLDITDSLPLYQLGLTTDVLLHQEQLTRNTFTSIVVASNTKGSFAYTEAFIEKYAAYLEDSIREDAYHWAKAHTAYWQKDLEKCLAILQDTLFQAPYFQLAGRLLNTQVYFDLYLKDASYEFFLFSFFDAFEKWLSREKMWSKANKTSFLRFVQICRSLAKAYGELVFQPEKVAQLLANEQNIQALNWLKQKRDEVLGLRS